MGRVRPRPPVVRSRARLTHRLLADRVAVRSWALIAVGAILVSAGVAHSLSASEAARDRWGRRVPVLVVAQPVAPGSRLPGRVQVRAWPDDLVPDGVLRRATDLPPRAVARVAMSAGTPVTRAAVSAAHGQPIEGAGRRRLAIALGDGALPVRRGDDVDVWATTDPSITGSSLSTRPVALRAVVVAVVGRRVVVAVKAAEVPAVATAVATATITLVGA